MLVLSNTISIVYFRYARLFTAKYSRTVVKVAHTGPNQSYCRDFV